MTNQEVPILGSNPSGMAVTPPPPQTAAQEMPLPGLSRLPRKKYGVHDTITDKKRERTVRAPGKYGGKYRRVWSKRLHKYYIKYGAAPKSTEQGENPPLSKPEPSQSFSIQGSEAVHSANNIIRYDGKTIYAKYINTLGETLYEKLLKNMSVSRYTDEKRKNTLHLTYENVTTLSAEIAQNSRKNQFFILDAAKKIVFAKERSKSKVDLALRYATSLVAQYIAMEHVRVNNAVQSGGYIEHTSPVVPPDQSPEELVEFKKTVHKNKKLGLHAITQETSLVGQEAFQNALNSIKDVVASFNQDSSEKILDVSLFEEVFLQIAEKAFACGLHCLSSSHIKLLAKSTKISYEKLKETQQLLSDVYTENYGKILSERIERNIPVPTVHPQIDPTELMEFPHWGYGHFNEQGQWVYGNPASIANPIILARSGKFFFGKFSYSIKKSSSSAIELKIHGNDKVKSSTFYINAEVGVSSTTAQKIKNLVENLEYNNYISARFWEMVDGQDDTYILNPREGENPYGLTFIATKLPTGWNVKVWREDTFGSDGWVMERSIEDVGDLSVSVIPMIGGLTADYICASIVDTVASVSTQSALPMPTQIAKNSSPWTARGNIENYLDSTGNYSGQTVSRQQRTITSSERTTKIPAEDLLEYLPSIDQFEKFISIKNPNKKHCRAKFAGSKYYVDVLRPEEATLVINLCANDGMIVDTRKIEDFDGEDLDIQIIAKLVLAKSHLINKSFSYDSLELNLMKGIADISSENIIVPEEETLSRIQVNSFSKPERQFMSAQPITSRTLYSPIPIARTPYNVVTKIRSRNAAGMVQAEYGLQDSAGQYRFRYKDDYPEFVPPSRVAQVTQALTDIALYRDRLLRKSEIRLEKSAGNEKVEDSFEVDCSVFPLSERLKKAKQLFHDNDELHDKKITGIVGNDVEIPLSSVSDWRISRKKFSKNDIENAKSILENFYETSQTSADQYWAGALLYALNSCNPKYKEENVFTAIENAMKNSLKDIGEKFDIEFTQKSYTFLVPNSDNGMVVSITLYDRKQSTDEKNSPYVYFWKTDQGSLVQVPVDSQWLWKVEVIAADNERKAVIDCLGPEDPSNFFATFGEILSVLVPKILKVFTNYYRSISESILTAEPIHQQLFFSLPQKGQAKDRQFLQVPVLPDCCMLEYFNEDVIRKWLTNMFPSLHGARQNAAHANTDVLSHLINSARMVDQERIDGYSPANSIFSEHDAQLLRIAMLLHDVGKASPEDGGVGSYSDNHHVASERLASSILPMFGVSEDENRHVCFWIRHHDIIGNGLRGDYGDIDSTIKHLSSVITSTYDLEMLYHVFRCDVDSIEEYSPEKNNYGIMKSKALGITPQELFKLARKKLIQKSSHKGEKNDKMPFVSDKEHPMPMLPIYDPQNQQLKLDAEYVEKAFRFPTWRMSNSSLPQPYMKSYYSYAKMLYKQAKNSPQLSFSKAFGMNYEGATGRILRGFIFVSKDDLNNIFSNGIIPKENVNSSEGIELYVNAPVKDIKDSDLFRKNFELGKTCILTVDYHSGKTTKWSRFVEEESSPYQFWREWKSVHLGGMTALHHPFVFASCVSTSALEMGYNTLVLDSENEESNKVLCLDPARIALISAFQIKDSNKGIEIEGEKISTVKFMTVDINSVNAKKNEVYLRELPEKELQLARHHDLYVRTEVIEDKERPIIGSGGLWNGSPGLKKRFE